jgi:hypothetical protein
MQDPLAPVIEIRAATSIARLRARRQALRVLDAERKTLARLVVNEPSIARDGRKRLQLTTRLSLIGGSGIRQGASPVRRVVEGEIGLAAAAAPLVDEAVARSGGVPGGVSFEAERRLVPAQRADSAAVAILTQADVGVEASLPATVADVDSGFGTTCVSPFAGPDRCNASSRPCFHLLSWLASARSFGGCRRSQVPVATSTSTYWSSTRSRLAAGGAAA